MTGYFSQLARHTGISVEPDTASAASSPATAPAVATPHSESAPVTAPHVEEITFTASPPSSVFEGSEGPAGVSPVDAKSSMDSERPKHTESKEAGHFQNTPATAKTSSDVSPSKDAGDSQNTAAMATTSIDVSSDTLWEESRIEFTSSESRTSNLREQPVAEQSPAGEQWIAQSNKRSGVEGQRGPQVSVEMVERQFARQGGARAQNRQAPRLEAKHADQRQPARAREQGDAVLDEQMKREAIVRNYLKEVRTWVAEPLEIDERELTRERDAERMPGNRDVFTLEQEVDAPSLSQPGRPETLEVQDLNLSIGTISIVIEEPKQTAPAALPAPPSVDRSVERTTNEPTRLSRYYLRSW